MGSAAEERRKIGLAIRTEVLGADYVQASASKATPFSAEFQDYLAENCWGLVWARNGLDRRSRSLITLTALAANDKWTEFEAHLRGAIRNGCTDDELREALFHMAVYLGVPTAVEAFRVAAAVFDPKPPIG